MEACLAYLKEHGADPALVIDPHTVVTAPWPRLRCQFGCESYGHNHCCPPEAPDYTRTRAVLDSFTTAILFRIRHYGASRMAREGARMLFLNGYYKALAFGSGPCKLCEACDPAGCRFPGKAIPSMEGCGIDVFATARGLGMPIEVLEHIDDPHNTYALILVE